MALVMGPVLIAFGLFSEQFFLASGHAEELAKQESQYFNWIIPGAWATVISASLVGLFSGSGRTRILVISDFVATGINIVLDVALIFGMWGFPEWGAAGAALASSIALLFKLLVLIIFAWPDLRSGLVYVRDAVTRKLTADTSLVPPETLASRFSINLPMMKRLFHFGWPAGVSVVAEAWSFTIIMMIVGGLGERAAAATTLALGVNIIAFIPLVGLGVAVGVLVGKYLVKNDKHKARRMVKSGLVIGLSYSLIFVVLYGGFPDFAMKVISMDVEPEKFDDMRDTLRPLLYFIAGYCLFDAIQTVFVGALKGAGDTFFVLFGHIVAGSVTVVGGIAISRAFEINNLYYWWAVITFWIVLLSIIYSARYIHGGWQNKKVIENSVLEESLQIKEAHTAH